MSRFSNLKKHLSFREAISIYLKIKKGNYDSFRLKKLQHPFSMRKNPYDYATFEEVLLREDYNIDFGFEPRTIIDGGANIGLTSVFFANKFPNANIVAVEPEKENFQMLQKNTNSYSNISLLNAGIWDHNTFLSVVDEGKGNNAFTVKEVPVNTEHAIKALSVYEIMKQQNWSTIDILKLDIEGTEKNIFEKNYESWLPFVRVLIVELHDRMIEGSSEAVFNTISKYNFSKEIKGENHIFFNLS
jgi:FkbM family methyltransferase